MAKRIYVVTVKDQSPRMIKAQSALAAMRHVWDCATKVEVASQDELVRLLKRGISVEETIDPPTEEVVIPTEAPKPHFGSQGGFNAG